MLCVSVVHSFLLLSSTHVIVFIHSSVDGEFVLFSVFKHFE